MDRGGPLAAHPALVFSNNILFRSAHSGMCTKTFTCIEYFADGSGTTCEYDNARGWKDVECYCLSHETMDDIDAGSDYEIWPPRALLSRWTPEALAQTITMLVQEEWPADGGLYYDKTCSEPCLAVKTTI